MTGPSPPRPPGGRPGLSRHHRRRIQRPRRRSIRRWRHLRRQLFEASGSAAELIPREAFAGRRRDWRRQDRWTGWRPGPSSTIRRAACSKPPTARSPPMTSRPAGGSWDKPFIAARSGQLRLSRPEGWPVHAGRRGGDLAAAPTRLCRRPLSGCRVQGTRPRDRRRVL